MKRFYLFSIFTCIYIILPQISFSYDAGTTHIGLTEQTVEFYNLNNRIKLDASDKELIIQGAVAEDSPANRPLNHFYDPIRNIGMNNYRTALEWALTSDINDFNWQKSILKYAEGDRDGALIGLGHILHLIEDMTVPDHTRNDAHKGDGPSGLYTGDSVYEEWAKNNKGRKDLIDTAKRYKDLNYKIKYFSSLTDFFKNIAYYSNTNYVSPDTIVNSVYDLPKVMEVRNGYAYGIDNYFYDKHKLFIEKYSAKHGLRKILVDENEGDFSVLEEYFSRLSKQAILAGAGVIDLFITEGEKARTEFLEKEQKRLTEIALREMEKSKNLNEGNFFSKIWYRLNYAVSDTTSQVFGSISNSFLKLTSTVSNGSYLVFDTIKNSSNFLTFTSRELASIGAQKIGGGITIINREVKSASEKVILYVKENSYKYISPAIAYYPPIVLATELITPSLIEPILSDKVNETNNESEQVDRLIHHRRNSRNNGEAEIINDIEVLVSTSTDDIYTNTIDELSTSTATTTVDIATTTEEIATSTATTTEEIIDDEILVIIDIEAPFVIFDSVSGCEKTLMETFCLLPLYLVTTFDISWSSSDTDISFYTITIKNNEGEEIISATTTESSIIVEIEDDGEFSVWLSATDISGNTSIPVEYKIAIYYEPVSINNVSWVTINSEEGAQEIILKNNTPYDIDLDNWSLITDDGLFNLSLLGTIERYGDFRLSRLSNSEDDPENVWDQTYTEVFGRASEYLKLLYFSEELDSYSLELNDIFSW